MTIYALNEFSYESQCDQSTNQTYYSSKELVLKAFEKSLWDRKSWEIETDDNGYPIAKRSSGDWYYENYITEVQVLDEVK